MILLDENIPKDERDLLRNWRIRVRHFGYEIGQKGTTDEAIIPFLHQQRQTTWLTLDRGFYRPHLRHHNYCLVTMDVTEDDVATFVRRFLRHPMFDTQRKRMGTVVRLSHAGLRFWRLGADAEESAGWPTPEARPEVPPYAQHPR